VKYYLEKSKDVYPHNYYHSLWKRNGESVSIYVLSDSHETTNNSIGHYKASWITLDKYATNKCRLISWLNGDGYEGEFKEITKEEAFLFLI
jgi:hypothetical protein